MTTHDILVRIETPAGQPMGRVLGPTMSRTLKLAIGEAKDQVGPRTPDLQIRDVLGGLRAVVRWRDDEITVVKT